MFHNSIFGGVLIQGFLFAVELRRRFPNLPVTEAHPKLLLHALGKEFEAVAQDFRLKVDPQIMREDNDDRRDAVLAALAAREGSQAIGGSVTWLACHRSQASRIRRIARSRQCNYWWFE